MSLGVRDCRASFCSPHYLPRIRGPMGAHNGQAPQVGAPSKVASKRPPHTGKSALDLAALVTPVVSPSAAPTLRTAGWTSQSTIMVPGEPFTPSSLRDGGSESLKHCSAPGVSGRRPAQAKEAEGLIFFFPLFLPFNDKCVSWNCCFISLN